MRLSNLPRLAAVSVALLCTAAVAQTRFCVGGDIAHMSAPEKAACSAKLQAVKSAAAAFHAPDGWHFVLVCGEQGWKEYAAFTLADDAALMNASADTNLEQHETFLREDRLDLANASSLRRVVAREVAGILLHSHDEVAISNEADLLMAGTSEAHGI